MTEFLLYGLLAALGWGTGDFLNVRSSRKTNPHNALVWTLGMLALLWLVAGASSGQMRMISAEELGLALAVGFFFTLGGFLFLNSTFKGKIAVASPVFALSAVVTVILALAFLGEKPTMLQTGSALLAVLGGVLVGLKNVQLRIVEENARILLPATVSHGVALTLSKILIDRLGVINGIAWFEALLFVYIVPFALLNKPRITTPVRENFGSAIAYFIGFYGFATALSKGLVSLTTPVANTFPIVAVGLAVFVYREQPKTHQLLGLALAVLGLVGVGI